MKIQFDKKNIEAALSKTIKAISPRSPLPILGYVLIKTIERGKVSFSTTDLEFGIECKVDANIIEEGTICVPARILTDLVGQIQEDKITLKLEGEQPLELTTKKSKYHINTREPDEFPILPVPSEDSLFTLSQSTFREIIRSVIIAVAAIDEQRAALTGVYLTVDESGITAVATDGRRLVKVHEPIDEPPKKNLSIIVPQRSMKEILNLIGDEKETIKFIFSEGQVFLEFDNVKVFSRVIDGKFPNYGVVIPRVSNIKALIDRKKFIDAVRRALIMALDRDTPDLIRAEITNESVRIMSNSIDVGDAYEEILLKEIEGDESLEIAVNGRYIYDVLNVLNDEYIWMYLNSPVMPVMLKSPTKDTYDYIVMPVRLRKSEENKDEIPAESYT